MTMYRLPAAVLAALTFANPAGAALTLGVPAGPAIVAAAPPLTAAGEPDAPAPPAENGTEVSGGVLLGMAFAGLLIVGIGARRRRPAVSVTS